MSRKLTPKQKKFAQAYLKSGNGVQAAKEVYNVSNYSSAGSIAVENLQKPAIRSYLSLYESKAEETMVELMDISKEFAKSGDKVGAAYASVAKSTAADILDRTQGKATQRLEVNRKSVDISINLSAGEPL